MRVRVMSDGRVISAATLLKPPFEIIDWCFVATLRQQDV
jgi:hypothetical protein